MRAELIVDNGTVNCPRRGDTEVKLCFGCPELLDIQPDNGYEVVVCNGPRRVTDAQVLAEFLG
jgi:hypothetical protein